MSITGQVNSINEEKKDCVDLLIKNTNNTINLLSQVNTNLLIMIQKVEK